MGRRAPRLSSSRGPIKDEISHQKYSALKGLTLSVRKPFVGKFAVFRLIFSCYVALCWWMDRGAPRCLIKDKTFHFVGNKVRSV